MSGQKVCFRLSLAAPIENQQVTLKRACKGLLISWFTPRICAFVTAAIEKHQVSQPNRSTRPNGQTNIVTTTAIALQKHVLLAIAFPTNLNGFKDRTLFQPGLLHDNFIPGTEGREPKFALITYIWAPSPPSPPSPRLRSRAARPPLSAHRPGRPTLICG